MDQESLNLDAVVEALKSPQSADLELLRKLRTDSSLPQHVSLLISSDVPSLLSSFIVAIASSNTNASSGDDDNDHRYKTTLAACSCLSNLCTQNARLNEVEALSKPAYLTPLVIALSNDSGFTEKQRRTVLSRVFAAMHNTLFSLRSCPDPGPAERYAAGVCEDKVLMSNIYRYALPTSAVKPDSEAGAEIDPPDQCTEWISRLTSVLVSVSPSIIPIIHGSLGPTETGELLVFLNILGGLVDEALFSVGHPTEEPTAPCPAFDESTVAFFSSAFEGLSSSPSSPSFSLVCDILGSMLSLSPAFPPVPPPSVLKAATAVLSTSAAPLQKLLLKLVANLLHCNPSLQSSLSPPDIYAVLNSTSSLDTLGLREYAVLAVKAICEDEGNARLVEELRAQAVEDSESMKRAGVKAEMGEDGKVKMVKR